MRSVGHTSSSDMLATSVVCGTAIELVRQAQTGHLDASAAVEKSFARADLVDKDCGIFISRFDETAATRANELDHGEHSIDRKPLLGVPVAIKDIFLTSESRSTYQSHVDFSGSRWNSLVDATAVKRLRSAGAIVTGKTTTSEFACGPPDLNSGFPTPRNPFNINHWTGGSSAGSAAAVASGVVPIALGSDTGGSIRNPAAFCGVVGFKGSRNLVPTNGCFPLSPSLDHVGVLSVDVAGVILATAALAPNSNIDSLVTRLLADPYEIREDNNQLNPLRIGVDWSVIERSCGPEQDEVVRHFRSVITALRSRDIEICEVQFPMYDELERAALVISRTEALMIHGRLLSEQSNRYSPATRQVLLEGLLPSATDYAMCLIFAKQVRRMYRHLGTTVDALVMPTALQVAPQLKGLDFNSYHTGSLTRAWNLTGAPAISLPMGIHARSALPLGLQLVGQTGKDRELLATALNIEAKIKLDRN